jgi:hypothetical protein
VAKVIVFEKSGRFQILQLESKQSELEALSTRMRKVQLKPGVPFMDRPDQSEVGFALHSPVISPVKLSVTAVSLTLEGWLPKRQSSSTHFNTTPDSFRFCHLARYRPVCPNVFLTSSPFQRFLTHVLKQFTAGCALALTFQQGSKSVLDFRFDYGFFLLNQQAYAEAHTSPLAVSTRTQALHEGVELHTSLQLLMAFLKHGITCLSRFREF